MKSIPYYPPTLSPVCLAAIAVSDKLHYIHFISGILSISSIADVESEDDASGESDDDAEEGEAAFDTDYASDITACKWFPSVDFVVENGPRGLIIDETSDRKKSGRKRISLLGGLSTIVDLTTGRPVILRQGRGELDVDNIQT